jgi:branched-chain amino acid transport system substrate-binding protein
VLAVAPLAPENQVVAVNIGGQGANLAGISPYVFSTIELGTLDVQVLATYMWKQGIRTIATAFVNNATGQPNAALMKQQWLQLGGTVLAEVSWSPNAVDFGSQVAVIQSKSPQGIYLAGQPNEAAYFVKQIRAAGSKSSIFSYQGIESPEMLSVAGAAANGIVYTAPHLDLQSPDAPTKVFLDELKKSFGADALTPTVRLSAQGYDGANVVIETMRQAPADFTGKHLHDQILKTRTFQQITGVIKFANDGTVSKTISLNRVENGKYVTFQTITPQ